MICQLTRDIICRGQREATRFIRWTMRGDPSPVICESVICDKCLAGRPSFINILEDRPVQPTDRTSM